MEEEKIEGGGDGGNSPREEKMEENRGNKNRVGGGLTRRGADRQQLEEGEMHIRAIVKLTLGSTSSS